LAFLNIPIIKHHINRSTHTQNHQSIVPVSQNHQPIEFHKTINQSMTIRGTIIFYRRFQSIIKGFRPTNPRMIRIPPKPTNPKISARGARKNNRLRFAYYHTIRLYSDYHHTNRTVRGLQAAAPQAPNTTGRATVCNCAGCHVNIEWSHWYCI